MGHSWGKILPLLDAFIVPPVAIRVVKYPPSGCGQQLCGVAPDRFKQPHENRYPRRPRPGPGQHFPPAVVARHRCRPGSGAAPRPCCPDGTAFSRDTLRRGGDRLWHSRRIPTPRLCHGGGCRPGGLGHAHPEVRMVAAHTLPELTASTRVLKKNGFVRRGIPAEEGAIRFELDLPASFA